MEKSERDKVHDARRRELRPWRAFYKTPMWRGRRALQLQKQPLCERHLARGELVAATVANHKVPHRGDWKLFSEGELESSCKPCHDADIQREEVRADMDKARGYATRIGLDGYPVDADHPFNRGSSGGV